MSTFAIRFDFPDGPLFAGEVGRDGLGFALTIRTALLFDDPDYALRLLENGYGPSTRGYGKVVPIRDGPAGVVRG